MDIKITQTTQLKEFVTGICALCGKKQTLYYEDKDMIRLKTNGKVCKGCANDLAMAEHYLRVAGCVPTEIDEYNNL